LVPQNLPFVAHCTTTLLESKILGIGTWIVLLYALSFMSFNKFVTLAYLIVFVVLHYYYVQCPHKGHCGNVLFTPLCRAYYFH
jgi:hypothetical protein